MLRTFIYMATLVLFASESLVANGRESVKKAMLQDLEAARYNISFNYAPKEWKRAHIGWTLDRAYNNAKRKILSNQVKTSKDYQKVFAEFLGSTCDYHVSTLFYSTACSFFPITVKGTEGHYYLMKKDLSKGFSLALAGVVLFEPEVIEDIEEAQYGYDQLREGDEILSIDGIAIGDYVERIIDQSLASNRTATGYALAEKLLFLRCGSLGHETPKEHFQLTLRRSITGEIFTYTFPWIHIEEKVKNRAFDRRLPSEGDKRRQEVVKMDYSVGSARTLFENKQEMLKLFSQTHEDEKEEDDEMINKGFLPLLGPLLWTFNSSRSSDLYAYEYLNYDGNRIGYLRLATFSPADASGMVEDLEELFQHFNEHAEALVIDLTDNPGGSLFYTYTILSMLTDAPLHVPMQKEVLSQAKVYNTLLDKQWAKLALEENYNDEEGSDQPKSFSIETYCINEAGLHDLIAYCDSVIGSWEAGSSMTEPLPILGVKAIEPHSSVNFTKPLIVLTNALDFSCGDFFPAILQDNGRGLLFGQKTAGAGGYVMSFKHPSRFGVVGYTLTGSIAYRPSGQVIENLGVTPDIPYRISVKDLTEEYTDYIQTLNIEIKRLLERQP